MWMETVADDVVSFECFQMFSKASITNYNNIVAYKVTVYYRLVLTISLQRI